MDKEFNLNGIKLFRKNNDFAKVFGFEYKEIIEISGDFNQLAAIIYISTIVYPRNINRRTLLLKALLAHCMKYYFPSANSRKHFNLELRKIPAKQVKSTLNRANYILKNKNLFVSYAFNFFLYSKTKVLNKITRDEIIRKTKQLKEDVRGFAENEDDIRTRQFNLLKPILHLNYGFFEATDSMLNCHQLEHYIYDYKWVKSAIDKAEEALFVLMYDQKRPIYKEYKNGRINFDFSETIRIIY